MCCGCVEDPPGAACRRTGNLPAARALPHTRRLGAIRPTGKDWHAPAGALRTPRITHARVVAMNRREQLPSRSTAARLQRVAGRILDAPAPGNRAAVVVASLSREIQSTDGFCAPSITTISIGPLVASSFNPSCSWTNHLHARILRTRRRKVHNPARLNTTRTGGASRVRPATRWSRAAVECDGSCSRRFIAATLA